MPLTKRPNIIIRSNEQQRSRKIRTVIRCIAFSPLFFLLLERAFFYPFENNNLIGYLDVEHVAVTTTSKTARIGDAPSEAIPLRTTPSPTPTATASASATNTAKSRKSLEKLTRPFRLTDAAESVYCPIQGTKIINGYHHLGSNATTSASTDLQRTAKLYERKIPKILHQQGTSRCVPSALYDLNQQWKEHLLSGDDNASGEEEEWSVYFHTEHAMARLFRAVIGAQQQGHNSARQHQVPLVIANEFPHLGQILRNCVDNGSYSKRLLWRFLCLYIYGGVYSDLEYAPPPLSYSGATNAILRDARNDAIVFLVPDRDDNLPNPRGGINTNLMAVSPEHPLMYYAVHHLLFLITTDDGYAWRDEDDDDAATQQRIVSNVLERAMFDFVGNTSTVSGLDGAQQSTNATLGTTHVGTNGRTVSIIGTPGSGVDTAKETRFFETIQNSAKTSKTLSSPSGNVSRDQEGRSGYDESRGVSPPLCMRKILSDILRPP